MVVQVDITVYVIFYLVACLVIGAIAQTFGRGLWSYFAISLVLTPVLAIIILLLKGKATTEEILQDNRHMYYCPSCKSVYSGKGKEVEYCPDCKQILFETTVLKDDWKEYDKAKKDSLKKAFAEGKYSAKGESKPEQTISSADELKKYKELLDMGAITQEEYDKKKKQLLNL